MARTIGDAMNDLWKKGIKPVDDTKAPLNSPALTGTPTAPTPAKNVAGSDRLATTAYVLSLLKNNPGIIDELLTAINGKLDKTTADSTYLKSPLKIGSATIDNLDVVRVRDSSEGTLMVSSGGCSIQVNTSGDAIKLTASGGVYANGTKLA